MSWENVEFVRGLFAEFNTTQRAVTRGLTPDFVWDMSRFRGWPEEPRYYGPEAFDQFFAKWAEPYEEWEIDLEEVRDVGDDRVLVLLTQRGRLPGSASWVELALGNVVTITDGLASRFDVFGNRADALEAVGLSE